MAAVVFSLVGLDGWKLISIDVPQKAVRLYSPGSGILVVLGRWGSQYPDLPTCSPRMNSVYIRCTKTDGTCTESVAQVWSTKEIDIKALNPSASGNRYLTADFQSYRIVAWGENIILAKGSEFSGGEVMLKIDLKNASAEKRNDKLCFLM
ncbi:MAG: hypothetical protein ACM3PW_09770 [Chlamydiota bacterium]